MQITSKDFRRLTAWPLLLAVSILAAPISGFAQLMQADDYFHQGAQDYIFGEKEKAVQSVATGLQLFPQDPKLNAVAKLLQKKEQQQQQNQSKNQNQDQKKQDKQDQQKNSQNQNQKQQQQQQAQNDQQKQDEQKKQQQEQQARQDQQKKEQEAQANKSDERQSGETNQAGMMMAQMTPQEARQLLDAQRDDEKALIYQPTNTPSPPINVTMKDW